MRSTISTLATVATGLLASTVSAQGKVAIYWGQGAYQKELSVVCKDPSVDIVNIAFVNGFPKDSTTYPDTNFGNACGGEYFQNPNGTPSKLLASCGVIEKGITECHNNGKKVLLSLGGGYPTDYYIASDAAAKWLAQVLVGSFGVQTDSKWPRPFGASFVDGFDLDIESSTAAGDRKWQYYAELVNYIKALSPNMLISSAPQCVVPDAHLDDAISRAPFDYVFTQFYNTDSCSAKLGWEQRNQKETGFTFDKWTARLQEKSFNKKVKLFMGLPAGTNGANPNHYLTPVQANDLVTKYKNTALWGGVMLWEATVSQNNTVYGQGYSSWIKYSIEGKFTQNYHPVVSSTIRSSSTLVSSTRSSTVVSTTSSASSTKVSTSASSTKVSTSASSTKISTSASSTKVSTSTSSTKTSSATPSSSSTPVVSSSSAVPSSTKSSSAVLSSSSTIQSSSTPAASSTYPASSSVALSSSVASSSFVASSSSVAASSSVYVPSSSSVPVDVSSSTVEYSATSSSVAPSSSSVEYTDYFSTAIPTHYSSSATPVEPSTVYPEDVSSTVVYSSSSADVTSSVLSASSTYEASSTPAVTTSASDYSSVASSSLPSPSASESSDYSTYPASSTADYDVSSSTTPIGASSTPCTTSTELYPESSKTPEASASTSEYLSYSESSKVPEAFSTASEYPSYSESSKVPEASSSAASSSVVYPTESTKTPEVSTSYSAGSSTPSDASSTPCTTSTEVYSTSSKTPEASSATDYSYYSESSKVPEASSQSSKYPVEYPTGYDVVSTKTSEASSAASEYSYYSGSSPVPDVSSKTSGYPVVSTKTPVPTEYEIYSSATPTVTKPAESTTTVVTTTYLDTCSTGLTTKTATITKTVCNACAKPSDKPEGDYPSDWTTSVYVDKTLTVTITKPIHPATDVPAYPTSATPKPSAPAAEYPVDKENVSSYETPAKSSSVPYEATKPSPKPEVPSYPEVPSSEKPSAPAVEYPVASSKPSYPKDATVTLSQYITLTKVATPVAYTPVAYATPIVHQGYPVSNGTVPSSTGGVKPSATGTGKPVKPSPSGYAPPEFEGAASKLGMGMTGVVAVVAFFVL